MLNINKMNKNFNLIFNEFEKESKTNSNNLEVSENL